MKCLTWFNWRNHLKSEDTYMAGMLLQGCQCNRGGTSTEPHGGGQNIEHLYRMISICMHSDNFRHHIFGDHHSLGLWCILLWPLLQFVLFKVVKNVTRLQLKSYSTANANSWQNSSVTSKSYPVCNTHYRQTRSQLDKSRLWPSLHTEGRGWSTPRFQHRGLKPGMDSDSALGCRKALCSQHQPCTLDPWIQ